MLTKQISAIAKSKTGRNLQFRDNLTGRVMNLKQFTEAIESGKYSRYHNRIVRGLKTPCSNPDYSRFNNLS
ncbi:MAG: hypothetical protein QNJ38_09230 [Prochloraceae cyanobacterium]|nr:hypothetical protein [Prochloraceae cyanobacterium]